MPQSNPQERRSRLSKSICATAMAMSLLAYTPGSYAGQNQGQNSNDNSTAAPSNTSLLSLAKTEVSIILTPLTCQEMEREASGRNLYLVGCYRDLAPQHSTREGRKTDSKNEPFLQLFSHR